MKNTLQILALLSLLFIHSLHAQIVCTDIIPDTVLNTDGEVYPLDLNNDGFPDFIITLTQTPGQYCCSQYQNNSSTITPQYGDAILVTNQSTNIALIFSGGIISSSSLAWSASADLNLAYESHYCTPFGCSSVNDGAWSNANDEYAALRIKAGADTLYGWVRMSVGSNGSSVTIKNYAYNSVSNMSLHAGDTCSVASGIFNSAGMRGLSIFPNPNSGAFMIDLRLNDAVTNQLQIDLIDILGREVFQKTFQCNGEHFTQQIKPEGLHGGVYQVCARAGAQVQTCTIVIQ